MDIEKRNELEDDGWLTATRGRAGYESYLADEVAYKVTDESAQIYIPPRAQKNMGIEPGEDYFKVLRNDEQEKVALAVDETGVKFTDSNTVSVTKVRDLLGNTPRKCKLHHNEEYDIWLLEPTDEGL